MSFAVAVQSAIFYFVACTPCTKVRHRAKARQQAKKDREKHAIEAAQDPDTYYRHPSPFNTNPFWEEEIMMGPSLPKKGKGAVKNPSQRGLTSAGHDSDAATRSSLAVSTGWVDGSAHPDAIPSSPVHSPVATPGLGSAPTVLPDEEYARSATLSKTASVSTGDDWNRKRYQREDEELWGHEISRTGHKLMDAIKQAGSSAGRYVEAKLGKEKPITDEDRREFYLSPRNPPVNDYHPPVVSSKPAHRDGHRWMLQPPPPAKVMEGKIPVSRSASMASMASRRTMASGDGPLARFVGEKSVEARLRKGEMPVETGARSNLSLNRQHSRMAPGQQQQRPKSQLAAAGRRLSFSTDSDDSLDEGGPAPRRKPKVRRPMAIPPLALDDNDDNGDGDNDDDNEFVLRPRVPQSTATPMAHAAQRPRLSTIHHSDATDQSDPTRSSAKVPSGAGDLKLLADPPKAPSIHEGQTAVSVAY